MGSQLDLFVRDAQAGYSRVHVGKKQEATETRDQRVIQITRDQLMVYAASITQLIIHKIYNILYSNYNQ